MKTRRELLKWLLNLPLAVAFLRLFGFEEEIITGIVPDWSGPEPWWESSPGWQLKTWHKAKAIQLISSRALINYVFFDRTLDNAEMAKVDHAHGLSKERFIDEMLKLEPEVFHYWDPPLSFPNDWTEENCDCLVCQR